MASFVGGPPVTLAGQTWTVVVSAPGAGSQRRVENLHPINLDSVAHVYEGRLVKAGTPYGFGSVTVQPGQGGDLLSAPLVLAATDESIEVRTAELTSGTESKVFRSIFEVP